MRGQMASLPPFPLEAKKFLKSTFKLRSLDYKNVPRIPIYNVLMYGVQSTPLRLEAKIFFWKLNFKLRSKDYKNLTLNAVKWHSSPSLLLEAKKFLQSDSQFRL